MITASTGNHGQSIAYAARLFGVRGDDLRARGREPGQGRVDARPRRRARRSTAATSTTRASTASSSPREHGYRYVHSGNEPRADRRRRRPRRSRSSRSSRRIEAIVVPIGGGSGAAGACIVAKAINPAVRGDRRAVGAAPAAYRSWRERRARRGPRWRRSPRASPRARRSSCRSRSCGSSSTTSCSSRDDEIRAAQRTMIETTRNLSRRPAPHRSPRRCSCATSSPASASR